jgi:hypothetical protein
MVEACDDEMMSVMSCRRGVSTTRIAFALAIIILAIAALIFIPKMLLSRPGLESNTINHISATSSVAAGICSTPPCSLGGATNYRSFIDEIEDWRQRAARGL